MEKKGEKRKGEERGEIMGRKEREKRKKKREEEGIVEERWKARVKRDAMNNSKKYME